LLNLLHADTSSASSSLAPSSPVKKITRNMKKKLKKKLKKVEAKKADTETPEVATTPALAASLNIVTEGSDDVNSLSDSLLI